VRQEYGYPIGCPFFLSFSLLQQPQALECNRFDLIPSVSAFTQTSVDASTGAHVHFVNPSNGMKQILCVGTNGHCAGVGLDPRELLGTGLRAEAGQTVTVVFSDSGDFPITSKTRYKCYK